MVCKMCLRAANAARHILHIKMRKNKMSKEFIEIDEMELMIKSSKAFEDIDEDEHIEAKRLLVILNEYKHGSKKKSVK